MGGSNDILPARGAVAGNARFSLDPLHCPSMPQVAAPILAGGRGERMRALPLRVD